MAPDEARSLRREVEADPRAREALDGIFRLKELVRDSSYWQTAPASLRRSVLDGIAPREVIRLRRWAAAAAVVLAVGAGAIYVNWRSPSTTFAHGLLVERCVEEHRFCVESSKLHVQSNQDTAAIRDELRRLGLDLERVPRLLNTAYCGASKYRCDRLGIDGVRLVYEHCDPGGERKRFSVYVFLMNPEKLDPALVEKLSRARGFTCTATDPEYTVFCRLEDGLLVHVVGAVSPAEYETQYLSYFCSGDR